MSRRSLFRIPTKGPNKGNRVVFTGFVEKGSAGVTTRILEPRGRKKKQCILKTRNLRNNQGTTMR